MDVDAYMAERVPLINAAIEETEIEALITKFNEFIAENGGSIIEVNKWGRRRLAYPINRKYNGFFVYTIFEAPAESIATLERFHNLEENIIRHLTLQLDPKLREFRKTRAEAQAKRAAEAAAEGNDGDRPGGRGPQREPARSSD